MAITSTDIQNQSFAIDRKGYMVDEVDDFLEHVADEIDALNEQIADLERQLDEVESAGFDAPAAPVESTPVQSAPADSAEKDAEIADLKAQLANAKADGSAIAQALIVAQRSADDIVANAHDKADKIIADAQAQAAAILEEAESDRQQVEDSITALEEERASVRGEYQGLLKDFIADATNKLDVLNREDHVSAHARSAETQVRPASAQAPVRKETPVFDASVFATPVTANQPTMAAATPNPSAVEKDFSGFGDTVDDFGFDDID